jgi:hypothetical protein
MARQRAEGPQKKKKIMGVKRPGISGVVCSAECKNLKEEAHTRKMGVRERKRARKEKTKKTRSCTISTTINSRYSNNKAYNHTVSNI